MNKYYIGKLEHLASDNHRGKHSNRKGRQTVIKFLEIQYERKPPTFGLLYLKQLDSMKQILSLEVLELENQQQAGSILTEPTKPSARFLSKKQIDYIEKISTGRQQQAAAATSRVGSLVCFDTIESLLLKEDEDGSKTESLDCILLLEYGHLYGVDLIDGSVKRLLTANCCRLFRHTQSTNASATAAGEFIQCKLQKQQYIHLLSENCYYLYKLSSLNVPELINTYDTTKSSAQLEGEASLTKFVGFQTGESENRLVILELADFSLLILLNCKCFGKIELAKSSISNHWLLNSVQTGEHVLLTCTKSEIIAHNLQVNLDENDGSTVQDPDRLLMKEPSFELEKCWSLDINEIDNIRPLVEEEEVEDDCLLCPLWFSSHTDEQSYANTWPRLLLVTYKCHILVYSFEQPTVLPFSIVYDSSFINLKPLTTSEDIESGEGEQKTVENSEEFVVDLRTKPKLVRNFKLIGTNVTDTVFNNLFLNWCIHLRQNCYFPTLALLISVSDLGDIIALKLEEELRLSKDNLYQQLVVESIKSDTLLKDQLLRLQQCNQSISENIDKLEKFNQYYHYGSSMRQKQQSLVENLFELNLVQRSNVGCLYDLQISISNLIRVSQIIIISDLNVYFLDPLKDGSSQLHDVYINNNVQSPHSDDTETEPNVILLTDIDQKQLGNVTSEKDKLIDESVFNLIQAFVILELKDNPSNTSTTTLLSKQQSSIVLDVPMFIRDSRDSVGKVKVFFILDNLPIPTKNLDYISSTLSYKREFGFDQEADRISGLRSTYFMKHIDIKPLMSYQSSQESNQKNSNNQDESSSFEASGIFTSDKMMNWLNQYLNIEPSLLSGRLKSPFTHCFIEYHLQQEDKLEVKSDDLFALTAIRRHILGQATDESLKLDIHSQSSPDLVIQQLKHLLKLQCENLSIYANLARQIRQEEANPNEIQQESLFESILLETTFPFESGTADEQQKVNDMIELSLKTDIEKICINKNHLNNSQQSTKDSLIHEQRSEQAEIFRGLIIDSIVDILVDYENIFLSNKTSRILLVEMRHILDRLIAEYLSKKTTKNQFADNVLEEWTRMKLVKK